MAPRQCSTRAKGPAARTRLPASFTPIGPPRAKQHRYPHDNILHFVTNLHSLQQAGFWSGRMRVSIAVSGRTTLPLVTFSAITTRGRRTLTYSRLCQMSARLALLALLARMPIRRRVL